MPTFVPGEVVSAAKLNAATARDWATWVPTFTNLNVGSTGVVVARYQSIDNTVFFFFEATLGGSGISVGDMTFSAPVNLAAHYLAGLDDRVVVGQASLIDSATGVYNGVVVAHSATALKLRGIATTALQASLSSTSPFTWAAADRLIGHGWYEAA